MKKSSLEYKKLVGLWSAERIKGNEMNPDSIAQKIKTYEDDLNDEAKYILKLIKALSPEQMEQIKMAIERPKVLEAIETLNELYAA